MVEYTLSLDNIFSSLSDSTRRDILALVARSELSVGQIAKNFDISFAAVSKHIKVLEKARLVIKRKQGKEQLVSASPKALTDAYEYFDEYKRLWEIRLDSLAVYLEGEPDEE